jgi:hypothetical protein
VRALRPSSTWTVAHLAQSGVSMHGYGDALP